VYGSPALFVVSYVFHRFRLPRHPSYALSSLIIEQKEHPKIQIDFTNAMQLSKNITASAPAPRKTRLTGMQELKSKLQRQNGGGERDRTDDLRVANATLSQLSYTPEKVWWA
jgi:hypothetical protein